MVNTAGLDSNSTTPGLSWKVVTKGRRSRKPSLSRGVNLVNRSPKRVVDFSESVTRQEISEKVEYTPIKKRRHLLQLSSPSQVPSGYCEESPSPESMPTTQSEELVGQLNSDSYVSQQSNSCDGLVTFKSTEVTNGEYYNTGDFSGIALLAAAACNDDLDYNSGSVEGGSNIKATSFQQNFCVSTSPSPMKPNLSVNSSVDSAEGDMLPDTKVECSSPLKKSPVISQDLSERAEDGKLMKRPFSPKIDRLHWDLNTSMDSWEQPHDDTVRRNALNNVICNEMHKEKLEAEIPEQPRDSDNCLDDSEKCITSTKMHPSVLPSVLNTEKNKGGPVASLNATCGDLSASKSTTEEEGVSATGEVNGKEDKVSTPNFNITESHMQFEHKGTQSDDPASPSMKIGEDGHNSDISQVDDVQPIGRMNVSGFQASSDSPFEDGKLQGSVLYSWEENEVDCEMECVDYETDGDALYSDAADDHSDSEVVEAGSAGSHRIETRDSPASIPQEEDINTGKQSLRGEPEKIDFVGKKGSDAGSGTTTLQHQADTSVERNIDVRNRRRSSNHTNAYGFRQAFKEETSSSANKGKLQSRIGSPLHLNATDGKDAVLLQNCSPHGKCGSYTRPKRNCSSERYVGRYRSSDYTKDRNVLSGNWGYSDSSSNHYSSTYHGSERRAPLTWQRSFRAANDEFGGTYPHDYQDSVNYSSNVTQRSSIRRRSSVGSDDYVEVPRGRLAVRGGIISDNGGRRGSRRYDEQVVRVFREEGHDTFPDDVHNFSPFSGRAGHISLPRKRSRSPQAWHSQRDPSFEARMERTRVPFQKPRHAVDHGSPTSKRFSPHQNPRWVGNRNPMDNHLRHRRSPMRRTSQQFEDVGSGGLKSDDYFRPGRTTSSGRFPPVSSSDRRFKLDETYNYKRHDDRYEMIHEARHSDKYKAAAYNSQTVEEFHRADQRSLPKIARKDVSS